MSAAEKFEAITMPAPEGWRAYVVESKTGKVVTASAKVWPSRTTARTEAEGLRKRAEAGERFPHQGGAA